MSVNWGPCALGDHCLQPEHPSGEWVQMVATELGAQLHKECADTLYGSWLQMGHAMRAFARTVACSTLGHPRHNEYSVTRPDGTTTFLCGRCRTTWEDSL